MIDITDRDTGTLITQITEEQLALLIRELEEESMTTRTTTSTWAR